jgi:hypothetical protein
MLQRRFKTLYLALGSLLVGSCGSAPKVTICISDPLKNGFQCVDHDKKEFFIAYQKSENYVAMSPDDFRQVVEWVKVHCDKQEVDSNAISKFTDSN